MKIRYCIIRVFFYGCMLSLFSACRTENKNTLDHPEKLSQTYKLLTVRNEKCLETSSISGKVVPSNPEDISFEVSGRLEMGELPAVKGAHFRKDQLLFQINNEEIFMRLSSRKKELKTAVVNLQETLAESYPQEQRKWVAFEDALSPASLLPALPAFSSEKEKHLFESRGVLGLHAEIKQLESGLRSYFLLAPFDGRFTEVYHQPGHSIRKGRPVAAIAKNRNIEVVAQADSFKIKMHKEDTVRFLAASGQVLASGNWNREAKAESGGNIYYFTVFPGKSILLKEGMQLKIQQVLPPAQCTKIPVSAMHDGKVRILQSGKVLERKIVILREEQGNYFVSGLNEGEKVIL